MRTVAAAAVRGTGTVTTGGKIVETRKDGKVVSRAHDSGRRAALCNRGQL